ncbi:UNVERIFIED_CONTAM: hypothetical protein K2H54_027060 [Gekko kuhli]
MLLFRVCVCVWFYRLKLYIAGSFCRFLENGAGQCRERTRVAELLAELYSTQFFETTQRLQNFFRREKLRQEAFVTKTKRDRQSCLEFCECFEAKTVRSLHNKWALDMPGEAYGVYELKIW